MFFKAVPTMGRPMSDMAYIVLGLPEIDRRAIWVEPKAEPGKACYAMGASRSSWLVVRSK